MESLRLQVRRRTLLLNRPDFVFITEDGVEVEKANTEGVVRHAERSVNQHLRRVARAHGRTPISPAPRQFYCSQDEDSQLVAVEPTLPRVSPEASPIQQSTNGVNLKEKRGNVWNERGEVLRC